jgi:hypothetical protein
MPHDRFLNDLHAKGDGGLVQHLRLTTKVA